MGKEKESNLKTYLDIPEEEVDQSWSNLRLDNHRETSRRCDKYNCIAWVLGIDDDKWAPYTNYTWFKGQAKIKNFQTEDVSIHMIGFKSIGYEECNNGDFENGFEKIAFYVKNGSVEHVAKQTDNGTWTSKLGEQYHDIEHSTLQALEGKLYGKAKIFMRRGKEVRT